MVDRLVEVHPDIDVLIVAGDYTGHGVAIKDENPSDTMVQVHTDVLFEIFTIIFTNILPS